LDRSLWKCGEVSMGKDLFSHDPNSYARYRPSYPEAMFDWLKGQVPNVTEAWDAGTGNGQLAIGLAKWCGRIYGTDISESQLKKAMKLPNIVYLCGPSEATSFPDHKFDLITVGQAIHWFDLVKFYAEVNRVARRGALLVLAGYAKARVEDRIDAIFDDFYVNKVGPFWEPERSYVDKHYRNLPFPFEEVATPQLENKLAWNRDEFIAYMGTWSSLQKFRSKMGYSPLEAFDKELSRVWPNDIKKEVRFPILLKVGRVS
jgi:ubiquinone/menaquinone biosynthesis C-methylase UbiE